MYIGELRRMCVLLSSYHGLILGHSAACLRCKLLSLFNYISRSKFKDKQINGQSFDPNTDLKFYTLHPEQNIK